MRRYICRLPLVTCNEIRPSLSHTDKNVWRRVRRSTRKQLVTVEIVAHESLMSNNLSLCVWSREGGRGGRVRSKGPSISLEVVLHCLS